MTRFPASPNFPARRTNAPGCAGPDPLSDPMPAEGSAAPSGIDGSRHRTLPTPSTLLGLALVLAGCSPTLDAPSVSITPERPTTLDDLTVAWTLPDKADDAQVEVQWFQDDKLISGETGETLTSERTTRSERWGVEVTLLRNGSVLSVGTADVLIQNAPPSLTLTVGPEGANSLDDLVATATPTDPDPADVVDITYQWTRSGTPTNDVSDTVRAASTEAGQTWVVTATPHDGFSAGEPATAEITVLPSPPIVRDLAMNPNPPTALDPTTLTWDAIDPDGTATTVDITWKVNGSTVATDPPEVLPAGSVRRGNLVAATVTATDADGGQTSETLEVTAGNSLPTVQSVVVEPEIPTVQTPITCTALGLDDADGDAVTVAYDWLKNGQTTSVFGSEVDPEDVGWVRGDVITCLAIASDSAPAPGVPAAAVQIGNAPPVLASVAIVPAVDDQSPVTSSLGPSLDPDGDTVSFEYSWKTGSQTVSTDPVLDQDLFGRGDTVRLFVTPVDALGLKGTPVEASGSFTAVNRPPTVLDHTVSAEIPTKDAPFEVEVVTYDADGDNVSLSWTWTLGTGVVAGVTGPTFPTNRMVKNATLYADVVPNDGSEAGPTYRVGPYTIGNAIPVVVGGAFEAGGVQTLFPVVDETTSVRCLQTGMSDADNDGLALQIEWTIDDVIVSTAATITSTVFSRGDLVTCTLFAHDGVTRSAPYVVGTFEVINAPPVLGNIVFSPSAPTTVDTLRASVTSVTDPDGTPGDTDAGITLTWRWEVGGLTVPGATGSQLPSEYFKKGDFVTAFVTATDADGATATKSRSVTVRNSAPTITSAQLVPTNPRTDSVITIEGVWGDPDASDVLTPIVTWSRRGNPIVGQSGLTLDGAANPALFAKGDTISATLQLQDQDGLKSSTRSITAVTVVDAAPDDPTVLVSPRWSTRGDRDLRCEVAVNANDPDGDAVTYTMAWYRDDVLYEGGGGFPVPTATTWPGDTIPRAATAVGNVWRCVATAYSGSGTNAVAGGTGTAEAHVGDMRFRDLGLGGSFGCARDAQNTTRCWGRNGDGQTEATTTTLRRLFVGTRGACGLDESNTLRCWGRTPSGAPGLTFRDIAMGSGHACGRTNANNVLCWGINTVGQAPATPQDPRTGSNVIARQVVVGASHSCALRTDGSIHCWGETAEGRLEAPDAGPYIELAAGADWTCALDLEGAITCWGDDDDPAVVSAPTLARYVTVASGSAHACAIDVDDRLTCWGDPALINPINPADPEGYATVAVGDLSACAQKLDGTAVCWGSDAEGQLVPSDEALAYVSLGSLHSCYVDGDGNIGCWGRDDDGEATPPVLTREVLDVAVGDGWTCARTDDKNMRCWGDDFYDIDLPPTSILFEEVSPGLDHACALSPTDKALCWGRNLEGQAESQTTGSWIAVSAGSTASCGIDGANELHCWGSASNPILTNVPTGEFRDVDLDPEGHACAITDPAGTIECWGKPGVVIDNAPGNAGLESLVVGRIHACALDGAGSVLCWGNSDSNRLDAPNKLYDQLIDGRESTCAVRDAVVAGGGTERRTDCWGPVGRR